MVKKISVGLAVAFMFTACATQQKNIEIKKLETKKAKIAKVIATDATESEIKEAMKYEEHIEKVKKYKKRRGSVRKAHELNVKKFCFKDAKSIHYRADERCK